MWVWIILCIISLLLAISIYYNYKFAMIILGIQDSVEDSLDVLDERYASISRILEIPIFYDSNEVRQVLKDIEASRESILQVARQLTNAEIQDPAFLEQSDEEEEVA
mgnify:CR=1 FL=1